MNAARLIAVDIGNSSTKLGWFDAAGLQSPDQRLGSKMQSPDQRSGSLPQPHMVCDYPTGQTPPDAWLSQLDPDPVRWRVASVQREGQRVLARWVLTHRPQDDFRVLSCHDLPLAVRVDLPERVGVDRLAAALAANVLREAGRPAIVICTGTAVTINVVASDGGFEGGAILAGFRMQAEALFGTADLLPLTMLSPADEPPPVLGKNTDAAIRSGLFWGAVGAVREIVQRLSADLPQPP
ncbi:MAG: type III pantothenate kinase, partial [Pirellulaceae bacterium]